MLYYERTVVSVGIDVKTSVSRECIICHCWYFLDKGGSFQLVVCCYCHDVLVISCVGYHCVINEMGQSEPINFKKMLI